LNPTPIPGKPGAYHAPQYVLNTAEQAKKTNWKSASFLTALAEI
jgi:hypothetical protein